jgi:hypothetical protein
MAHIHPTGWREMSVTGTAAREIETLATLEASLADAPYRKKASRPTAKSTSSSSPRAAGCC